MTLRVCLDCTTAFAPGAPRCPHCRSERHAEEGTAAALGLHARGRIEEEDMPKITLHGGPSDRHAITSDQQLGVEEAEGGEGSSPGNSSETSTSKPQTKSEPSDSDRPRRARTTGSRSSRARTGSSSAGTTGGKRTEPTSDSGAADGDA